MIRFALTCDNDHQFESWFQSGAAFDTLTRSGHVNCVVCGSATVSKTVMAPAVQKSAGPIRDLAPEGALAALKDKVETNADYVGQEFATEARAIHDGTKPDRAIYGEANVQEARALLEDGVPVLPLPFVSRKRLN